MAQVIVKPGDDIEKAIRRFRKKVQKDGIMQELRSRQYYEKPGDKKRREKKQSINRVRKEARNRGEYED